MGAVRTTAESRRFPRPWKRRSTDVTHAIMALQSRIHPESLKLMEILLRATDNAY